MSDAKKYHVGDSGLIEGEALGRITVYLAADYDRLIDVYLAAGDRAQALATRIHHLEQSEKQAQETVTLALSTGARVALERDALQQRLTVQDQRVDELERDAARYRWLRDVSVGPHMIDRLLFQTVSDDCNPPYRDMKHGVELDVAIDAAIKPTAEAVSHE
jgi:uncharacterized protein Yka (UPF0111/DUF47 family)